MGTIPASENVFPMVRFAEGAAPATPAAGEVHLYALADGKLVWKNDAGAVFAGGVPWFDVKAYGAAGDVDDPLATDLSPYTDDTAAIQAAIDAATAGGTIYFPPGIYRVDGELSVVVEGITFMGAGRVATKLQTTSTDQDLVTVEANHFRMVGMSLSRAGATAGAGSSGLYLKSGTYASVEDCTIAGTAGEGFYDTVKTLDAHGWTLFNTTISDAVRYGVLVRNTAAPDTGDSTILACILDTAAAADAAIRVESSGGLRIVGNKISHHDIGVDLQVADGVNTSVLIINGNSIEAQDVVNIRLGRSGTTGLWGGITITGNQILGGSAGDGIIYAEGAYSVIVSGNAMLGDPSQIAIDVQAAANMASISGNTFTSWGTGIKLATTAALIAVGQNTFLSVPTPIEDNVFASYQQAWVDNSHRVAIINLTSAAAYTNKFSLDLDSTSACRIAVVIEGTLDFTTGIGRAVEKLVTRGAGGNCTVTAIGDTAAGTAIDLQFDVTTTAGSVLIGVKRNAGAGGARVDGSIAIHVMGHAKAVKIL
jgi:hypothetical protein